MSAFTSPRASRPIIASMIAIEMALQAGGAIAQTAGEDVVTPPEIAAAGSPERTLTIDKVVVTASKREETVQSAPVAVTAISSEQIESLGIQSAADLQFQVPGLQVGKGSSMIFIRGVGLNEGSGSTSPGVAVYFDGVYQARTSVVDIGQMDVERIEVLRGPQGTLYGRNATGGVINFISQSPDEEPEAYVEVGYATYDELSLKAMANVPVSDRVRTRLAVSYRDRSQGFVENIGFGPDLDTVKSMSGRLKTEFDLTDSLEATLSVYATHEENKPYNKYIFPYSDEAIAANPILGTAIVATGAHKTAANTGDLQKRNLVGADLTLVGEVAGMTVTSTTSFNRHKFGFSEFDSDSSNLNFMLFKHLEVSETYSQQLDFAGVAGSLDWVAGLSYINDDFHNEVPFTVPLGLNLGGPLTAVPGAYADVRQDNETTSSAVYVDLALPVSESVTLIAGGRYTQEESDVLQSIELVGLAFGGFPLPPGSGIACQDLETNPSFDNTTWRAGAKYEPGETTNVYATVSRGFKSGGVNVGECGNEFRPESVTSYEAGYKGRLMDDQLSLGASIFHYDYTDLQLFQFLPLTTLIQNAPEATVNGLEFEAVFQPDDHWTLRANATFLDAEYGDFLSFDDINRGAGQQQLKGNRLNYSPEAAGNFGLEYRSDAYGFGRLKARADVSVTGKQYFRPFNDPKDAQDTYSVVNLNLIWDSPNERLTGRLFVRNLADEEYLTTLGSSGQYGSRFGNFGAPRQAGVELRARF